MKGYIPTMFLTVALMIGATSTFAGDGILIKDLTGDGILIKDVIGSDENTCSTSDSKGGIIDIIFGTFFNTKDGILIKDLTETPTNCGILIKD